MSASQVASFYPEVQKLQVPSFWGKKGVLLYYWSVRDSISFFQLQETGSCQILISVRTGWTSIVVDISKIGVQLVGFPTERYEINRACVCFPLLCVQIVVKAGKSVFANNSVGAAWRGVNKQKGILRRLAEPAFSETVSPAAWRSTSISVLLAANSMAVFLVSCASEQTLVNLCLRFSANSVSNSYRTTF